MEVEEVARFASAGDALERAGGRLFDLEHVRAPVAELAGRGGPGARAGQVEHEDVFEGEGGHEAPRMRIGITAQAWVAAIDAFVTVKGEGNHKGLPLHGDLAPSPGPSYRPPRLL